MDNRIDFMDYGSFLGLRATGHQIFTTYVWLYEREVDLVALQEFAGQLDRGLLGRLIERSSVPCARPRWVRLDRPTGIDVEDRAIRRSELQSWAQQFACGPLDPELGPPYRLGVVRFVDGGSAVTLVVPHVLGDGMHLLTSIAAAVRKEAPGVQYPEPRSRTGWRAVLDDVREVFAALPAAVHAVASLRAVSKPAHLPPARQLVRGRAGAVQPAGDLDAACHAAYAIDREAWDACASRLGGTSNSLLMGIAARFGDLRGRTLADDRLRLALPVSLRKPLPVGPDTRANALGGVVLSVDPASAAEDLQPLRALLKQELTSLEESREQLQAVLPLTAFMPRWLVRLLERQVLAADARAVGASNYGDLPAELLWIDKQRADGWFPLAPEPRRTAADLERINGLLYLLGSRSSDVVTVSVSAYQPGGINTLEQLDDDLQTVLDEFGLKATPF